MTKNALLALGAIYILSGCVTRYDQANRFQKQPLDPQASAFISVPKDGSYGKDQYAGSGVQTAEAVRTGFFGKLKRISEADGYLTQDEAFSKASNGGFEYLIEPSIGHWEDRATEWSGLPDRIQINIQIYTVTNKTAIAGVVLSGASSWWTLGGDRPQDLLLKPIADYANSLFGQTNSPSQIPPTTKKK